MLGRWRRPPPPPALQPALPSSDALVTMIFTSIVGLALLLLTLFQLRRRQQSKKVLPPPSSPPTLPPDATRMPDAPLKGDTPTVPDIEDCHRASIPQAALAPETAVPLGERSPLYSTSLRQLHIELSSKCNAACPQCLRNVRGGRDNPRLPLTDLSLADVKRAVDPLLPHLKRVLLCGNYGDPSACRECLAVVRYLRQARPSLVIGFFTNGGAKAPAFWMELGKLLIAPSYCRFAIDGLADTNHLYRQKVRWSSLEANVRAFVVAGGNAQQDFIVFRHNEHQVEMAQAWARQMGIRAFNVKRTKRFVDKSTGELLTHTPVENAEGDVVRRIEPPCNSEYRNDADTLELQATLRRYGSIDAYYDRACIDCKAQKDAEAYLSAEGYLFPCCFLGGELYNRRVESQLLRVLTEHGQSLESLRVTDKRSILEVLETALFTHLTVASWGKASVQQGKLRMCAAVCGTEHRSYLRQWRNEKS